MRSMIIADTWDSGGQNARFAAASSRLGHDIQSIILNDGQDLAGISARFAAAAGREKTLTIRAAHRQQTYLDYPYDLRWKPDTEPEIKRLADEADIIHLNDRIYGYVHFNQQGKPALLHHHGSAFRGHSKQLSADAKRYNMVECVSTVDLLRFGGSALTWLPAPYHAPTLAGIRDQHKRSEDGKIRIVQTPTNRAIKSTSKLEAAIMKLRREGLNVELVVGEKISNAEALAVKATADIFFDQVQLGYGCSAIEAWGMGLPVIAGGDAWTEARMRVEFDSTELPFYKAVDSVESIYDAVQALASSAELRSEYGARGKAHFDKFHDERQSLRRLVALYVEAMDPNRIIAPPVARSTWYSKGPGGSIMTKVTFTCSKYPALMVRIEGRSFKFAGRKLTVGGTDVDLIYEWANRKPEYGITSDATFEPIVVAKPDPAPATPIESVAPVEPIVVEEAPMKKHPSPNAEHPTLPELRKALRAMGLPSKGTRDELEARIAEGYGESVVYKGEVTDEESE